MHSCVAAHEDVARMRALDEARSPSWMDLAESLRLELAGGACLSPRTLLERERERVRIGWRGKGKEELS